MERDGGNLLFWVVWGKGDILENMVFNLEYKECVGFYIYRRGKRYLGEWLLNK